MRAIQQYLILFYENLILKTFTLSQTKTFGTVTLKISGNPVELSQVITQPASGNLTLNVVFLGSSIVATGVFDVVDPVIAAHTKYIDRKYWDARKTRGCLCSGFRPTL